VCRVWLGRPGLVGVADLGARLVAVQRLDGGADVENPGGTRGLAGALAQGRVHPGRTPRQLERAGSAFRFATTLGLVRRQMGRRAAQAFIADDFVHAQYLGGDFVAAQPGNVCITSLPVQDRQQPSTQYINLIGRIGAGVGHWTSIHPAGE